MYVDGFVVAVPKENKQLYIEQAIWAAKKFKEFVATRVVECWQNDVPHGKKTDFYGAVQAMENEDVLFSWVEYPSKEIRDQSMKKMEEDPEMKEMFSKMPFDGSRMIFGGFETIVDL